MKASSKEPSPGVWRSGIHKINTLRLISKVVIPRLRSVVLTIPSANTVQGLTPIPTATKSAFPKQEKINPKTKPRNDLKGGRKVDARGALHHKRGTD